MKILASFFAVIPSAFSFGKNRFVTLVPWAGAVVVVFAVVVDVDTVVVVLVPPAAVVVVTGAAVDVAVVTGAAVDVVVVTGAAVDVVVVVAGAEAGSNVKLLTKHPANPALMMSVLLISIVSH